MLFLVALTAAALAALGQVWSTAAQRERELELGWRGAEIARAIASYAQATAVPPAQYPRELQDLLVDRRGLLPRHHLRRLYLDPFTRESDWVLVPEASQPGRFSAVRSRSEQVLLREVALESGTARKASEWVFTARMAAEPGMSASAAALSPSSPTR